MLILGSSQKIERSKIRLDREAEYLETERLHVLAGDRWTRPKNGGGVRGWATSPLASVVINATPDPDTLPFGTSTASNPSFITALQVRAGYRLCGALLKIGGGARKDALNFIDKFRGTCLLWQFPSSPLQGRVPQSKHQSFYSTQTFEPRFRIWNTQS